MKKKLACGCEIDYVKLSSKPKVKCPSCKEETYDANYCVNCGYKMK